MYYFFFIFTVRFFFSVTGEAETVYLLLNSVTKNLLGDNEIIFLMKGIEIIVHSFNRTLPSHEKLILIYICLDEKNFMIYC